MKWSQIGIKTLREKPADVDLPGHTLLARGAYIHKLASGLFIYSPLLLRSIRKFENIVREELNKHNTELLLPIVQPKEIWEQSGRWELYQDLLQKIKSRSGQYFCLGPTHEEAITEYIKTHIRSYRDMPVSFYQIHTKFRDEIRPRFGLLRAKEFLMKDAYSFDTHEKRAQESYQKMRVSYHRIFSRLKVPFRVVRADSGEIGGSLSEEFLILAEHGETDLLVTDSQAFSRDMFPEKKEGDETEGGKQLRACRGIEVGHIFYLGDKYSQKMAAFYLDPKGKTQAIKMGCYGIGITRTIQAVAEQSHDAHGIIWPLSITPFVVHISLLDPQDASAKQAGEKLYQDLWAQGIDSFLDDRLDTAGIKFKDADLLGFPLRITVGKRDLKNQKVELAWRLSRKKQMVPLNKILPAVKEAIQGLLD